MPPRLALALDQIQAVRKYVQARLDDVPLDDWFAMPGGISHIAWQAGHLAMAGYRMGLVRIRGEHPDDPKIMDPSYMKLFGMGSAPEPDPSLYPPPSEILATMARVQEAVLANAATLTDDDLDADVPIHHPLFTKKIDSLLWCSRHEMMHGGQIGMIRRLLGRKPLW